VAPTTRPTRLMQGKPGQLTVRPGREDGDMGYEGQEMDVAAGVSPAFAENLYRRWKQDRSSVDPTWGEYFGGVEQAVSGPSWARPTWPPTDTDALTAGLDPTQMEPAPKPAKGGKPALPAAPAAAPADKASVEAAALDSIRAMMLIRTYRV